MLIVNSGEILLKGDQLNIWFILNGDDRYRYIAEIDRIRQSNAFTLGIYDFQVESLKRGVNPDIPSEELRNAIASHNIMMRLFNDENDNHIFAFENIDLSLDIESWWRSVHNFVLNTAEQNRQLVERTLAKRRNEKKRGSEEAIAEDEEILAILDRNVTKAKEEFELFIADNLKKSVSKNRISKPKERHSEVASATTPQGEKDLNRAVTQLVNTIENKEHLVKELLKLFAKSASDSNTLDESDGAIPTISIERVETRKYGRMRSRYGIVVTTANGRTPISFLSVDQTMIYITAMLRYKLGSPLRLFELYEQLNNRSYILKHRCPALKSWLRKLYNTIVDKDGKNADRWINKIGKLESFGHPLYQAKSAANRVIRKALGSTLTAEYCLLTTTLDSHSNTYYSFGCPPENITVDETLQALLEEFPIIPISI